MFLKIIFKLVEWAEKMRIKYLCEKMTIGTGVVIKSGLKVSRPKNIFINNNVSIHHNCTLQAQGKIIIGKNVIIAANCTIVTANHDISKRGLEAMHAIERKPVSIGEGCWLGANVIVLPGVSIGEHSVIAAGSIVCKDMPANMVCIGAPAKAIKKRPLEQS